MRWVSITSSHTTRLQILANKAFEDVFIFNHVRSLTYINDCAAIKSKNKND